MGQDIREMFRNEEQENKGGLPKGHDKRFRARLEKELPQDNSNGSMIFFLKIAAVVVVALGIGGFLFFQSTPLEENGTNTQIVETSAEPGVETNDRTNSQYRLSSDSPEFKKIEDYYLASLNLQLAKLELTPENKTLVDAFMSKLETLNEEYLALNSEIKESGINGETVEAMIANLQLRLDLLKKLKNKLTELEQSKNNKHENYQA